MTANILHVSLVPDQKHQRSVMSSIDTSQKGSNKLWLPPSENFSLQFENYVGELAAKPNSVRSACETNNQPYELGKLPNRPRPRLNGYYRLPGKPWHTSAVDLQKEATDYFLYTFKGFPSNRTWISYKISESATSVKRTLIDSTPRI